MVCDQKIIHTLFDKANRKQEVEEPHSQKGLRLGERIFIAQEGDTEGVGWLT